MVLAIAVVLAVGVLVFTLFIRGKDIPEAPPVSPTAHLEEKKARIYENLRDLQFEYRVGKLSDDDYQKTKQSLQTELAGVLAAIDTTVVVPPAKPRKKAADSCPHCGSKFPEPMRFCGAC